MLDRVVFRPRRTTRATGRTARARRARCDRRAVLAIAGEHDRAQPPGDARRIAAPRRSGELLIIDGAGHFPFAETPDRYWPPLIDWLNRTAS